MNILFVEIALQPTKGGVERVTFKLFQELEKLNHNCYVFFKESDSEDISSERKYKQNENSSIFEQLSSCIKKWDINVLICQNLYTPEYQKAYTQLKVKYPIKIITELHCNPDIWVNKNKYGHTTNRVYFKELLSSIIRKVKGNPYKKKQAGMYNVSDKYVLLSESFKSIFCKINNVNGEKLVAINNPCSFSDVYDTNSIKDNLIIVVARMTEQQKRISEVLKIWKYVQKFGWNLKIIGDGPDLDLYKSMSKNLGLHNIEFLGKHDNPETFYKKAKMFLMTSIWEGFPMTLIEAQHYGCVPIAYDSFAAVHDIITNNVDGMIVKLHDRDSFITKISDLINNPDLLKQMSKQAVYNSEKKYSSKSIVSKWLEIIE